MHDYSKKLYSVNIYISTLIVIGRTTRNIYKKKAHFFGTGVYSTKVIVNLYENNTRVNCI